MGPMKAMKAMKVMKTGVAKPVKKTLGEVQSKAKAKGKALEKAKSKNKLKKSNLEKLGEMTLNQKIEAAAETGETLEEQAAALKSSLEKDERSQVWGRWQTYLKNNPEEKKKIETLSKKDKGTKAAEWLMETEGKNTCMSARASQPLSF